MLIDIISTILEMVLLSGREGRGQASAESSRKDVQVSPIILNESTAIAQLWRFAHLRALTGSMLGGRQHIGAVKKRVNFPMGQFGQIHRES